SYAHTKHFFLKLSVKEYKNKVATLPGGYAVPCIHITNHIRVDPANAITLQKTNINDVEQPLFDGN
ncbi:MAG TPA: hypothetical protein VEL70_03510, partial [Candidatus Acidoferrum sp.]|nr:hypothetical protein [Candidatus Acidoferrum sp.]